MATDVGRGGGITREEPKDAPRPPPSLLRPIFSELRRTGRAGFAVRITQGKSPGLQYVAASRQKSDRPRRGGYNAPSIEDENDDEDDYD